MREGKYIAIIAILAYSVRELWTVLPNVGPIKPFLLSDQEIQLQTYVWIASMYLFFLVFTFIVYQLSDKLKMFFEAVFIIQALELLEYFVNYNKPMGHIGVVPVNVTTLRFLFLSVVLVITFMKWKT